MSHSAVCTVFIVVALCVAGEAFAHGEGVLIQKLGSSLVTGAGDDTPGNQELGKRVFGNGLGSDGLSQSPSFFSLTAAALGTEALPSGVDLYWDFLPMTIGGVVSNLFHWDAVGQIEFTPVLSETLTLHDPNFNPAIIDGTTEPVSGLRIGTTTGSALNLHAHRWWWLQGASGTPADGVYLAALRVRADGYIPTEPIYFAFSTYATPITVLDDSVFPWVEESIDSLISPGDYNYDGLVDGSDYALWKESFGLTELPPVSEGYADGNRDGVINMADYTVWRDNLGRAGASNGASLGSAQASLAVPEPTALGMLVAGLLMAGMARTSPARPRRRPSGDY